MELCIKNSVNVIGELLIVQFYVVDRYSNNSLEKFTGVLAALLPDSQSVNDIELSRTKFMYVVNHAIALVEFAKKTDYFASLLDESLNEYTQLFHMDFPTSYCCSEKKYLILVFKFIGHGKCADLLKSFEETLNCIDLSMLQISMDGVSMNTEFLTEYKTFQLECEIPSLIDLL